jgi:hypothetical protein
MSSPIVVDAIRVLVDEYRATCLWFLREDYYPTSASECEAVLRYIERYGDLRALGRVADIRQWLSRPSNATSAAS